jgi:hypothetical protein
VRFRAILERMRGNAAHRVEPIYILVGDQMTTRLALTALLLTACSDPAPPEMFPCQFFDVSTGMVAPGLCQEQCLRPLPTDVMTGPGCRNATFTDRLGDEHTLGCFGGYFERGGELGCCIDIKDPGLSSYWGVCGQ